MKKQLKKMDDLKQNNEFLWSINEKLRTYNWGLSNDLDKLKQDLNGANELINKLRKEVDELKDKK